MLFMEFAAAGLRGSGAHLSSACACMPALICSFPSPRATYVSPLLHLGMMCIRHDTIESFRNRFKTGLDLPDL